MLVNLTIVVGILAVSAAPEASSTRSNRVAKKGPEAGVGEKTQAPAPAKATQPPVYRLGDTQVSSAPFLASDNYYDGACGHGGRHIPHGFHARGDMYPHTPYLAVPKDYYYFRPYQFFHIFAQQDEVMNYGGDRRNPYANEIFRNIYDDLEEAEEIKPGQEVPKDPAPAPEGEAPSPKPAPEVEPAPIPAPESTSNEVPAAARRSVLRPRADATPPNLLRPSDTPEAPVLKYKIRRVSVDN